MLPSYPKMGRGAVVPTPRTYSPSRSQVERGTIHKRRVAVLAAAQLLALVLEHRQGRGDLGAGLGGLDHGVDVPAFGRHVRVEQALGVVGLERLALLRGGPALQDRRRLTGAHHRQLGPRPRQAHVVAHRLGVHDDERAAVALAQDHADARHRRLRVGEHELRTVADHPPPLEVLAGVEAGRVDERDQRHVEGVAERDEPGRLLRGRDVDRAGERHRLVGDDADRPAVDRRERGDDVGRPFRSQLEQRVPIDDRLGHLADVVAPGRRRRDQLAGLGAGAVGGIVARPARGFLIDVVGEVGEQLLDHRDRRRPVLDDHARDTRVARQVAGPSELVDRDLHAGELLDHHRTVDERVARCRHHRQVGEPEQQRRTRHRGSVDDRRSSGPIRSTWRVPRRGDPNRAGPAGPRRCRPPSTTAPAPAGGVAPTR